MFYGFDISQWNGNVNMKAAKNSGQNFVIIRSSFGNVAAYPQQVDLKFAANVQNAKNAGLDFGVYHYTYATDAYSAKAEAKGFVDLLNSVKPIPYFVALDIEDAVQAKLDNGTLQSIIKAFIDVVESAGYYCSLYSYEAFLKRLSSSFRDKYAIWCANINYTPSIKYGVHQYSFTGSVGGINGAVDLDKSEIDYPAIIKRGGFNGYPKAEPTVLDTDGFKKGDKGLGVLAYKQLLLLAKKRGFVTGPVNNDAGFGGGTENATNEVLEHFGYVQNGIAGVNLVKKLGEAL
jgi:GH25 family lysozyme M1 (1,4-beta-N-acetylmuramidase)